MSANSQAVIYVRLYSFPLKLYDVIAIADPKVIRWINNGTAFKVFDTKAFEEHLLPLYYRHSKFTSFQRQLNLYGFKRTTKGDDAGAYCHPKFLQGSRDDVKDIKRISILKSEEAAIKSEAAASLDVEVNDDASVDEAIEKAILNDEPSRGCFTDESMDISQHLDNTMDTLSTSALSPPSSIPASPFIEPSESDDSNIDALFDIDFNSEQNLRTLYSPFVTVSV
jgi:HSF-type DNA-binding